MPRPHQIEFVNYICKFGREKSLLDLAYEVVLPAYEPKRYKRDIRKASYFFHDVDLLEWKEGENVILCLVGRIIKNTTLEREQVFSDDGGLIEDHLAIESAPSAIFALILNNHKLLYLKETAYAPDVNVFRATSQYVLRKAHTDFLNRKYELLMEGGSKVKKKDLRAEFPSPTVEAIPLSSEGTLADFVDQFSVLKAVETKLVITNDELDLDDLFLNIRGSMDEIGANQTTLRHQNPEGLSLDAAKDQLSSAAAQGNTKIKLRGKDKIGDDLSGNNEKFSLRVSFDKTAKELSTIAMDMYNTYVGLIKDNVLSIPDTISATQKKILQLRERISSDE